MPDSVYAGGVFTSAGGNTSAVVDRALGRQRLALDRRAADLSHGAASTRSPSTGSPARCTWAATSPTRAATPTRTSSRSGTARAGSRSAPRSPPTSRRCRSSGARSTSAATSRTARAWRPPTSWSRCDLDTGTPSSTVADAAHEINSAVYALTADSAGRLYAAGSFINIDRIPNADHVAMYDGTWHAMQAGAVDDITRSIASDGTNVYIGSDSVDIAGIAQADHVAKWNGTAWSALGGERREHQRVAPGHGVHQRDRHIGLQRVRRRLVPERRRASHGRHGRRVQRLQLGADGLQRRRQRPAGAGPATRSPCSAARSSSAATSPTAGGDGRAELHRPLPGRRPPADGGHPARQRRLLPVRRVHGLVRRQRERRRLADRLLPLELERRLAGQHRPEGRPPPHQAGDEHRHADRDRQRRAHGAGQRGLLHRRPVPAGAVHLVSHHGVRRGERSPSTAARPATPTGRSRPTTGSGATPTPDDSAAKPKPPSPRPAPTRWPCSCATTTPSPARPSTTSTVAPARRAEGQPRDDDQRDLPRRRQGHRPAARACRVGLRAHGTAAKAPVGTTFKFTLAAPAKVKLAFSRRSRAAR